MTEDLDVLFLLTDGATITRWNNEKLPSDRMYVENATILTNAERWPLMRLILSYKASNGSRHERGINCRLSDLDRRGT